MSEPAKAPQGGGHRLLEVDALRGIAAMAVVLFHFTTRYAQVYPEALRPTFAMPHGHYGVNLFFIVSGFVIFMTLDKTARPMDFVVSRFSRLYPVYWASVIATFAITHLLGLPGFLVSLPTMLANLLMFHGLLRVPNVDGVYWTLEVELLFYCGMLLIYRLGLLGRIHLFLLALIALRLVYFVAERQFGIDLPWIVMRLLILRYIAWFALGICVFMAVSSGRRGQDRATAITAIAALALLTIVDGWIHGVLGLLLATTVWAAASGRLPFLRHPVLVWLGAISYPLYLIHENVGWSLLLRLERLGLAPNLAVVLTLALVLALATLLHRVVEKPAMQAIRDWYRRRSLAPAAR